MPAPFLGGIESRDPSREVPRDRQFSAAVPPSLGKREKPSVRRQCRVSRACPSRFFARSSRPRAAISFLLADFSVTLAGHGYALKIYAARGRPGDQHGEKGIGKGEREEYTRWSAKDHPIQGSDRGAWRGPSTTYTQPTGNRFKVTRYPTR